MPTRNVILANNEIYHVFNRGVDGRPIFDSDLDKRKFINCVWFYSYSSLPIKLSSLGVLNTQDKLMTLTDIINSPKKVEILAYCLMSNHFHLLIRQLQEKGIQEFMSHSMNSYTRWFNAKSQRKGHLFGSEYKTVRINSDIQFQHVSRYIHLNPYTGYIVKTINELTVYKWSSLKTYISTTLDPLVDRECLTKLVQIGKAYKTFVLDNADYQRTLKNMKYLFLE